MPRNYVRKGLRASKGSVGHRASLSLSGQDLELVRAAAKRSGQTVQTWLRGAVLQRLIAERDDTP